MRDLLPEFAAWRRNGERFAIERHGCWLQFDHAFVDCFHALPQQLVLSRQFLKAAQQARQLVA